MKLKLLLAAVLATAVAVAAACSNDTFTGGDGGDDAGSDVPAVGGDGGSSDGKTSDGGFDAVASARFCEMQDAQFCADFDIPGDASAGFYPVSNGGWTFQFETADTKSPPSALEADSVDSGDAGSSGLSTILGNPFDGGANTVATLDLDIKLPPPSTGTMAFFFFGEPVDQGSGTTRFGLMRFGGSYRLANISGANIPLSGTVPSTGWTHVTLTIQLSQSGSVHIDVGNGSATADLPNLNTVANATPPYLVEVAMVSSMSQSLLTTSILYDNVVVHYQ